MICRLCLQYLSEEDAVSLFGISGHNAQTQLLQMISKYFQLELSPFDKISTSICQQCSHHLEEFHKFWMYVQQKQSTLQDDLKSIGCTENNTAVPVVTAENNEESLVDIKDVLVELPMEEADCVGHATNNETSMKCEHQPEDALLILKECKVECFETPAGTKSLVEFGEAVPSSVDNDSSNRASSLDTDSDDEPLARKLKKKAAIACVSTFKQHAQPMMNDSEAGIVGSEASAFARSKRNAEIITNFMDLACDLCKLSASTYGELCNHAKSVHQGAAVVRCCGNKFSKASKLVEHINWHRNPAMFTCDICQKILRSRRYLRIHKETKHGTTKNLVCEFCKKEFRSQKCLENHLPKHDEHYIEEKVYTCKKCNKKFRYCKFLNNHMQRRECEQTSTCDICNKDFTNPSRLRVHINAIHKNIFPFVCDTCGKKFKQKPSFDTHLLEHQGIVEPPVQCDKCGRWLKNKAGLRLHTYKHTHVNVECPVCGRICPTQCAMRRHVKYMHKTLQNLQCNFCDRTFKQKRNLEEHVATHIGVQLYACPHCSREFRSRSNMYVHIKRNHVQEWMKSQQAHSYDPNLTNTSPTTTQQPQPTNDGFENENKSKNTAEDMR